jgi:hypothetical protein
MPSVIITSQPTSVSVVPGQNTMFSATPSADFAPAIYSYQWKKNGSNISGATSSSYFIEPLLVDNGSSFTVSVSALSGSPLQSVATILSNAAVLTVAADSSLFAKFAIYPESGKERFTRLRNLGYV